MWQETKHGLFRQFNFVDFNESTKFVQNLFVKCRQEDYYPRVEIEGSVVKIWLITHQEESLVTDRDWAFSRLINTLEKDNVASEDWSNITNLQHLDKVKLFADGGSRGNPGPSSSGYVVLGMDNKIIEDKGLYLGITTNNQAEYTALKIGLEWCLEHGVQEVDVYMDSLLVINQMRGIYKVKNRDLWPIHTAIVELVKKFNKVSFTHVPREMNKLADSAVNRILDAELKS